MSVVKSAKDGRYDVYVYNPATGRNEYVGRRQLERDAKRLFREKTDEFAARSPGRKLTVSAYARDWLTEHHGAGTKRPAPATRDHNEGMLRPFLEDFGTRRLDGGIGRKEALRWARRHPHNAKTVAAMFNDAIDDEETLINSFANRRHEQPRGRQDVYPMTETEVERLAELAEETWGAGGYGLVTRALVLFGAWVGTRPGETLTRTGPDLDFDGGLVRVTRVKGRQADRVDRPAAPGARRARGDAAVPRARAVLHGAGPADGHEGRPALLLVADPRRVQGDVHAGAVAGAAAGPVGPPVAGLLRAAALLREHHRRPWRR
jgi:integrase